MLVCLGWKFFKLKRMNIQEGGRDVLSTNTSDRKMIESRCGIRCTECEYKEQMGCKGCVAIEKPFWAEACPVKSCCEERALEHCGMCAEFPCEVLKQFAYDAEQGDNGERLVQCRCWRVESDNRRDWIDRYLRSFPAVARDYKEEWGWLRYQVGEKMFAALCKDAKGEHDIITLKLEVLDGDFLRQQYEDIIPGHYMNKQHWNSIYLDGNVPEELIKELIEKSYKLVWNGLSKKKQKELLSEG